MKYTKAKGQNRERLYLLANFGTQHLQINYETSSSKITYQP